jgi:fumarate hydratase subunit alpha
MREIQVDKITETVARLCMEANYFLGEDMLAALEAKKTDQAVVHARAALDAGLPFGRLVAGPRDRLAPLYATDQYRQ